MAMFNSYVKLPEGILWIQGLSQMTWRWTGNSSRRLLFPRPGKTAGLGANPDSWWFNPLANNWDELSYFASGSNQVAIRAVILLYLYLGDDTLELQSKW